MENVLSVYEKEYTEEYPVVCFDERPCQLIDDILVPTPTCPGREKREDYHYQRNGTAVVLGAIEPLMGKRFLKVSQQKTKADYCTFMLELEKKYPEAEKIILIQDNLNTHNPSSFYENLPPEKALRLSQRFEMVYTPKGSSWLNMAEIEFSALSKQCLDRRIGSIDKLTKEVATWANQRNKNSIKINWQFTNEIARDKFKKHYDKIVNN